MKKKLSIGLVTSFIAAMGLTACSGTVTSSDKNVVTFKDYDGNEIGVITDEMFKEYSNSPSGLIYNGALSIPFTWYAASDLIKNFPL